MVYESCLKQRLFIYIVTNFFYEKCMNVMYNMFKEIGMIINTADQRTPDVCFFHVMSESRRISYWR